MASSRRKGADLKQRKRNQMTETNGTTTNDQPFYRIDRFVVPDAARAEFIGRVRMTHEVLRQQPGFVQDILVEQPGEPRRIHHPTIVEWQKLAVTEGARAAVAALHARENFDAQELITRLGIKADLGSYQPLGRPVNPELQPQYTRALGSMYWMSLVSVKACTGRSSRRTVFLSGSMNDRVCFIQFWSSRSG